MSCLLAFVGRQHGSHISAAQCAMPARGVLDNPIVCRTQKHTFLGQALLGVRVAVLLHAELLCRAQNIVK